MRLWRLVALLAAVPVAASAAEVAGIKLDERVRVAGSELELNGAGLRKKLFFRVYVAALYLTEKRTSATEILALPGPKRVSIILMRTLPAQELVDALTKGIRDNNSPGEQEHLQGRIQELTSTWLSVREYEKGDVVTFDWEPGVGTRVLLNGEARGAAIPGDDLYRAFLRVWMGERPTSAGLKRALLGEAR